MRRIVAAAMATVSGLVLLLSYHTSTNGTETQATTDETTESETVPSASPSTSATGTASTSPSASTDASTSTQSDTFTGTAVSMQYGDVQVRVTVEDGQITAAEAIEYPDDEQQSQEVNSYAIPILNSAVVSEQGADIDAVSGATFTSDAYTQSLQAALDEANL